MEGLIPCLCGPFSFCVGDPSCVSGPPEAGANHILHPSCLSVRHLHQNLPSSSTRGGGKKKEKKKQSQRVPGQSLLFFISSSLRQMSSISALAGRARPTRLPPVLGRQLDECAATARLARTGGTESRRNAGPCCDGDRRILIIASPQE